MIERQILATDGTRLYVEDEGTGPPVVFVGGYGMPGRAWSLQRKHLRASHRVIVVDRRCHGRSERVRRGQRIARHAKDLLDVLDALELQSVLLVGSSMGASTCLAHVDLFGTGRLRGLVLVDQTPKMINEKGWQLGFTGLTRLNVDDWVERFPAGLNPFHVPPPPEVLALTQDGPEFSVGDTRALLRDHTEQDWRDVLPRVDVPLLAVAGRHSPFWPWQSSEWMAEQAPMGKLVVLEDSGHVPFLEQPDAFNQALASAART